MNVLDRYATEVARHIPPMRGKSDFTTQVRAELDQRLAERARTAGRPADEAMELELLGELGAPAEFAAARNPHPYLVGPPLFPVFVLVARIVLVVLVTVLLVISGISIALSSPWTALELLGAVGDAVAGVVSAALGAFGALVLTFAILERFARAGVIEPSEKEAWDPATLLRAPPTDTVKPWEPVVAIAFLLLAIILFNAAPDLVGFYIFDDGEWTVTPLLTDAFFRWLPLMNIGWVAGIALNLVHLRTGRWTPVTRAASIAVSILQLVILVLLITGPDIVALTPELLTGGGFTDPGAAETVVLWVGRSIRIGLAFGILGTTVEIVQGIVRLVRAGNSGRLVP